MNIFQRFKARTPYRNKMIGRLLTSVSGILTAIETVLITYQSPVPNWLHQSIIGFAILTAVLASYHGQKVKK